MHGFCSFIYNILLIFLSLFSLSVSILGCYKSTQLCPSQFASNPPNTVQPPLNHHHHNPSQLITTHDIPITKSTKNKEKSNQKSIQTQNQTFNGKLNNLEPKIKLSTKKPSTQTQTQIEAVVITALESLLLPLEKRETSARQLRQRKRSKNKK